jgi:hypothetical protein
MRQVVPHAAAGPSRRHSKRIGALPLSSAGSGAEDTWTTPHASANALQTSRSMLTLIYGASPDAFLRDVVATAPSVPQFACLF